MQVHNYVLVVQQVCLSAQTDQKTQHLWGELILSQPQYGGVFFTYFSLFIIVGPKKKKITFSNQKISDIVYFYNVQSFIQPVGGAQGPFLNIFPKSK